MSVTWHSTGAHLTATVAVGPGGGRRRVRGAAETDRRDQARLHRDAGPPLGHVRGGRKTPKHGEHAYYLM